MGIMEHRFDTAVLRYSANEANNARLVPLMHDYDIGLGDRTAELGLEARAQCVALILEIGKITLELSNRFGRLGKQVLERPVVRLFPAEHTVVSSLKCPHEAAEEVRVPMIPIGDDGLVEE
jgi:hypothetical protein